MRKPEKNLRQAILLKKIIIKISNLKKKACKKRRLEVLVYNIFTALSFKIKISLISNQTLSARLVFKLTKKTKPKPQEGIHFPGILTEKRYLLIIIIRVGTCTGFFSRKWCLCPVITISTVLL